MKEPKLKSLEQSNQPMDFLVNPLSASPISPTIVQSAKSLSSLRKRKKMKMRAHRTKTQRFGSARRLQQKVTENRLLKNRIKKIETDMESVVKKMEFYFEEFRKPMSQKFSTTPLPQVSRVNSLPNGTQPSLQPTKNLLNGIEHVTACPMLSSIAVASPIIPVTDPLSPQQNLSPRPLETGGLSPVAQTQTSVEPSLQEINMCTPKVIRTTGKIIGKNEKSTFLQKLPLTLVRQITKQQIPDEQQPDNKKKVLPTVRITFSKKNDKLMISPNIRSSPAKHSISESDKSCEASAAKRTSLVTSGQEPVESSQLLRDSTAASESPQQSSKLNCRDSQTSSADESMSTETEIVTNNSSLSMSESQGQTLEKEMTQPILTNSNSPLPITVEPSPIVVTAGTETMADTSSIRVPGSQEDTAETEIISPLSTNSNFPLPITVEPSPIIVAARTETMTDTSSICVPGSQEDTVETEIISPSSTNCNSPIFTTDAIPETPSTLITVSAIDPQPKIESTVESKTAGDIVKELASKSQNSEHSTSDPRSEEKPLLDIPMFAEKSLTDGLMDSAFALKSMKKVASTSTPLAKPDEIIIGECPSTPENHVEVELGKKIRKGELGPEAFAAALSKKKPGWTTFYIDVWRKKSEDYIGLAWASLDLRKRKKRRIRSVFASTEGEAEAIAFAMVSEYMKTNKIKQAVVCSSSLNFLTALHHVKEDDYQDDSKLCIQPILDKIKAAKIQVEFWWCPSRAGIKGCERATRAAEDAIRYGKRIHPDRSSSSGHSS